MHKRTEYGALTRPSLSAASLSVEDPGLRNGEPCETLDKDGLRRIVDKDHVVFVVDLHDGEHDATAWGCDLT